MARGISVDPDTKKRVLDEYLAGAKAADVAARHQIPVKLLYNWKSNHQINANRKQGDSAKVRVTSRCLAMRR